MTLHTTSDISNYVEHDLHFTNPEAEFRQALIQAGAEVKPKSPPKSPPLLGGSSGTQNSKFNEKAITKIKDRENKEKIKKDKIGKSSRDAGSLETGSNSTSDRKRKKEQKRAMGGETCGIHTSFWI